MSSRPPASLCEALRAGLTVYVLKSKKDGELYIGWSDDLKDRVKKHNKGLVNATKHRIPLELIYYEASAIKREKQLKTGFGRAYLKRRLT